MVVEFDLLVSEDDIIGVVIEALAIDDDDAMTRMCEIIWVMDMEFDDEKGALDIETTPCMCVVELVETDVGGEFEDATHGWICTLEDG